MSANFYIFIKLNKSDQCKFIYKIYNVESGVRPTLIFFAVKQLKERYAWKYFQIILYYIFIEIL